MKDKLNGFKKGDTIGFVEIKVPIKNLLYILI
jgi:hypothetical protein